MPTNLNLELTDRCNLKCRMCGQFYMDEVHGAKETFMAFDTWKALIDGLADYPDEVHLCPHWLGEPTLHPEFDKFIRYAFDNNGGNRLFQRFKLHTNGVLFNEARSENLLDCANMAGQAEDTFGFIHFSIDALGRQSYRYVKGADSRDRVFQNILGFLEARARRGVFFPRVTLAFIVMPENRHEATGFLHYWRDVLRRFGSDPQLTMDWPSQFQDSIYFRRLNQEDQPAADILHEDVLRELSILGPQDKLLRGPESF